MTSKPTISQARSRSNSTSSTRSSSCSSAVSCRSRQSSKVSIGIKSPVLGQNFRIPDLFSELQDIQLDDTLPYVPVYCHFVVPEIEPIVRPKTPPILKALRAELEELQLIKPTKTKVDTKSRSTPRLNHRQSNKNRITDAN